MFLNKKEFNWTARIMLMLLEWPVVSSNPVDKEHFNGKGL